jgi:hypothetical protein
MAASDQSIVVRESRGKILLLWIGSAAFTAMGVWWTRDPGIKAFEAWGGLIFFGACLVISTLLLIRPGVLTLSPEGFRVQALWRNKLTRWDDVTGFRIWSPRRFTRYIVYDFTPGHKRGLSAALGFGSLPGNWSMSPPDLLALMNEGQVRWGGTPASSRDVGSP